MSSLIFYILGGFLQSKKQALRTSPTNRGSSLRYASGLPSAGAPILATKKYKKSVFNAAQSSNCLKNPRNTVYHNT